jgi:hypothetical protein
VLDLLTPSFEDEAATKGAAGLRPVSPAAHLAERFAAAEVRGRRALLDAMAEFKAPEIP